jgi:diguanylate cyclase (GGDEF)-like protein
MSAIFCIPDQDLTEIAYCDDLADPDIRSQFDATRKHLIAWVQLNNRPMVVNGIDNARTPFKILSCPVIGRSGQSNGLLALFRSAQSPNFELDDVVLIEILSRQAMSVAAQRYDPLTGLLNQSGFEHRLDQHLGGASAGSGALLYVDVPDLSAINAAFGYGTGDEVIRGVAQMLRASLATGERACRLSGHRFVVFCPDSDQQAAAARGAKLAESARQLEYVDADTRIPVQLRFAAAASPGGESCGRHWIAAAELACRET